MNPTTFEILAPLLAIAIALGVVVVLVYNGIIRRKNQVIRAWSDVVSFERQKLKALPLIEQKLSEYKLYESELLQSVTALRASMQAINPTKPEPADLAKLEAQSTSVMKGLQVTMEAYPELKAFEMFSGYLREMTEIQANIRAAIGVFNSNVEDFNSGIQMWPGSLVNSALLRKVPIIPFTDLEALNELEYRPNF